MLRRSLAIVTGVFTGWLIMFIGDASTHILFPVPAILHLKHEEAVRTFMSQLPSSVLALMFAFWLLATFTGGLVAAKINRQNWKSVSVITGIVLFVATIINMFFIPHPTWMMIASVLLIPASYLGGKIA
jgi:hypothetical protein